MSRRYLFIIDLHVRPIEVSSRDVDFPRSRIFADSWKQQGTERRGGGGRGTKRGVPSSPEIDSSGMMRLSPPSWCLALSPVISRVYRANGLFQVISCRLRFFSSRQKAGRGGRENPGASAISRGRTRLYLRIATVSSRTPPYTLISFSSTWLIASSFA